MFFLSIVVFDFLQSHCGKDINRFSFFHPEVLLADNHVSGKLIIKLVFVFRLMSRRQAERKQQSIQLTRVSYRVQ